MKLLTRERAQELANELGIEIIGNGPTDSIEIYLYSDFYGIVEPKKSWPYPRATNVDRGKLAWGSGNGWILGVLIENGVFNSFEGYRYKPNTIRLADPHNLTQPPPDGLED